MPLSISRLVREKLTERHEVTEDEIEECFLNRESSYLEDTREEHASDPPTQWFIAETDDGRKLKVVFIQKNGDIIIRTAYEPSNAVQQLYDRHSN